jgi:hypothetical protein
MLTGTGWDELKIREDVATSEMTMLRRSELMFRW